MEIVVTEVLDVLPSINRNEMFRERWTYGNVVGRERTHGVKADASNDTRRDKTTGGNRGKHYDIVARREKEKKED